MREVNKKIQIKANLIDKAIAWASPIRGARRMAARSAMGLFGGYHGGSSHRASMSNWQPGSGDANADINLDLPALRSRSRDLARNAPVATGAISTNVTHTVGTGLTMQPRLDHLALGISEKVADEWEAKTRREWKLWSESRDCDAARTLTFAGQQALALRSVLESGDVIALTPNIKRSSSPYELTIQLIEADRLSNPSHRMDTKRLAGGVEMDKNGAPIFYHISSQHPGAFNRTGMKWYKWRAYGEKTGRRNVLHLFEKKRPGQVRGVPYLAPVIEQLKQIARYTENELSAAVIAAAFAVFVKMDPEAFDEMFNSDAKEALIKNAKQWNGSIESGKAVNLLPGESIETANPGRPNSEFDPFMTAILKQIGMALEIPFEVLTMHFQSSYSASRAALLQAWRIFNGRRTWLAQEFCQPVYELFLTEAIALGRIHAPGFFADPLTRAAWCKAQWIGDGPGSLDPVKEVTAAAKRLDIGITTLDAESVLYDGQPWENKHRQQVKERKERLDGGLIDDNKDPAQKTVNEKRIDDGLEELPGGNAIYMPSNMIPTIEKDG